MALSKTTRISILLAIDSAFFLLELIVGYAVHSLALVADSFHMLNDVLSLCVGLWAVKIANRETNSKMYTYGWQRAETLGALVNGVFLVALCLSIFLEAIQRMVEPQEVKNPKLVLIVGCCGLASNVLGLALFHQHSHGHDHGHVHGEGANGEDGDIEAMEEEYSDRFQREEIADEQGSIAGVLPQSIVGVRRDADWSQPNTEPASPFSQKRRDTLARAGRRYSSSGGRGFASVENIHVHPATLRQDIIAASRSSRFEDEQSSESELDPPVSDGEGLPSERSGLLRHRDRASNYTDEDEGAFVRSDPNIDDDVHQSHNHAQPKTGEKKRHGAHDLNMRGVFLHVMGDALGNIGVIVSALIIWLTSYSWRFYVDPGISIVITIIILLSAIPLCKAASRILLQAVPPGMSIDHIKEDIERLPGVVSSHHLHVWQLSDTKIVASIHIQVDCQIKGEGSERYMRLARQVRKCLHAYGIHSSTIQPEFTPETDADCSQAGSSHLANGNGQEPSSPSSKPPSRASSLREDNPRACLLECDEECARKGQCCPKRPGPST